MAALPYGSLDYDSVRDVYWEDIKNKPDLAIDWTVDQNDVNVNANNIPVLPYAPNQTASNGVAGLSEFNFTESRKNKLAAVDETAQPNVQSDWDAVTGDAFIKHKPTIPSSLQDLSDCTGAIGAAQNSVLKFVSSGGGGFFEALPVLLNDLSDVHIQGVQNLQTLIYSDTAEKWLNASLNISQPTDALLNDSNITADLANGHVLQYDENTNTWGNAALPNFIDGSVLNATNLNTGTVDKDRLPSTMDATHFAGHLTTDPNANITCGNDIFSAGDIKALGVLNLDTGTYSGGNLISTVNIIAGSNVEATSNVTAGVDVNATGRVISGTELKGQDLILGGHTKTPKISLDYYFYNNNPAWHKNVTIGIKNDMPNGGNGPAFPPNNSLGINFQNNSDGLYLGIYEYSSGNYKPVLKWGDDAEDSPFSIEKVYPNGNIANHWDFHNDGLFTSKKLELDESIKAAKTGSNYRMEIDSSGRLGLNYNGVSNLGTSSNHTSNNIMLDGLYGHMSCKGDLRKYYGTTNSTTLRFSVNYLGQGYFAHTVTAQGTLLTSDDRLKHNEEVITNGLEIVGQLLPKKYDKTMWTSEFDVDLENGTVEAGFVAQEVLQTDARWAVVTPENPDTEPYSLDYNSLFTYAVAAIKQLDTIRKMQALRISNLETRLAALEG